MVVPSAKASKDGDKLSLTMSKVVKIYNGRKIKKDCVKSSVWMT